MKRLGALVVFSAVLVASPAAPQDAPLEFRALNPTVSYGNAVRFAGQVEAGTREPVRIFRVEDGRETAAASVRPEGDGRFTTRLPASRSGRYVARHGGRVSRIRQILVVSRVGLDALRAVDGRLILSGRTRPGSGRIRAIRVVGCTERRVATTSARDGRFRVAVAPEQGLYRVDFVPRRAGVIDAGSRGRSWNGSAEVRPDCRTQGTLEEVGT
jgi:hypothetical protein